MEDYLNGCINGDEELSTYAENAFVAQIAVLGGSTKDGHDLHPPYFIGFIAYEPWPIDFIAGSTTSSLSFGPLFNSDCSKLCPSTMTGTNTV